MLVFWPHEKLVYCETCFGYTGGNIIMHLLEIELRLQESAVDRPGKSQTYNIQEEHYESRKEG